MAATEAGAPGGHAELATEISPRAASLRAEVAPQERDHRLQLVVVLSRVRKKSIVAASFVVVRLDRLPIPPQCRLELTRQRDLRVDASTIGTVPTGALTAETSGG